jgi:hypothetical protein
MQAPDLLLLYIHKFNKLNLNYMVTGSVASILYGEPRVTHDIDMVIEVSVLDIPKIIDAFPLREFYCPPDDIIAIEIKRTMRGHFNLIHHETGFKADIYPVGNDEFSRWGLKNIIEYSLGEETIKIAPLEYVIIRKLEYYREGHSSKHIEDIKGILSNSLEKVDFTILEEYIAKYSLEKEYNLCR